MLNKRIRKVAVLGSGLMGTGIAAHLAGCGLEVMLLDLPTEGGNRNKIAADSLANALKAKPAPFYDAKFASRITTGNFDDDFPKIKDCDWVIEVVVERLDIKKQIYEKVDQYRSKGSLVTSNTSGIPIYLMAEGRSEDFRKNFCGTHFFNPVRYMRLAGSDTYGRHQSGGGGFFSCITEMSFWASKPCCAKTPRHSLPTGLGCMPWPKYSSSPMNLGWALILQMH